MTTTPTQSSGQTVRELLTGFAIGNFNMGITYVSGSPVKVKEERDKAVDAAEAAINSYVVSVLEELDRLVDNLDTQHTIKLGSVVKWREVRDLLDAAISKHKGEKTKWEN